jgi:hypothetical protein
LADLLKCGEILDGGGEGEIRTHGPREGTPVFKSNDPRARHTHSRVSARFVTIRESHTYQKSSGF